jgi:hypothetical protein
MVHWVESYKMGKAEEVNILPILREYFGRNIKQHPERYSKYDYYDDKYQYEVKTRTNALKAFDTTMITENKVRDGINSVNKSHIILLFNFSDCIASIEFNEEKFKSYERRPFSRAKLKEDEKEHIYIPITDLNIIFTKEKKKKKIPPYIFSD